MDLELFMDKWRRLCGGKGRQFEDFSSFYRHFTTICDSRLRFRGGSPEVVRERLQALASSICVEAYAELEFGAAARLSSRQTEAAA